jgi:hypothetical protein
MRGHLHDHDITLKGLFKWSFAATIVFLVYMIISTVMIKSAEVASIYIESDQRYEQTKD